VTGTVDWNTIAPATFPRAMTSFPSFVQMRLFAASGSSVASGASRSATNRALKPIACENASIQAAKIFAPKRIPPNANRVWPTMSHAGGLCGSNRAPTRLRYVAKLRASKAAFSSAASSTSDSLFCGVRSTRKR